MPAADEVTAIVIENGSSTTRIGYSGYRMPTYVVPTAYAKDAGSKEYLFGDKNLNDPVPGRDIYTPMFGGCVSDWDAMAAFWQWIYAEKLHVAPNEHPLAICEQAWNSTASKQRAVQVAFEQLEVPVFTIVKSPICAAYESRVPTALVIDVGASQASVCPVLDGQIAPKAVSHSRFAGDFVNVHLVHYFKSTGIKIVPSYKVKQRAQNLDAGQQPNAVNGIDGSTVGGSSAGSVPGLSTGVVENQFAQPMTESFEAYHVAKVLHDFKETTSQVSETPLTANSSQALSRLRRPFEFPDGFNMQFGSERFTTTEPLFRPQQFQIPGVSLSSDSSSSHYGLTEMIHASLSKLDVSQEVLYNLLNNIVITGGTSLLPGLAARIEHDLIQLFPNHSPRFYLHQDASDRKNIPWAGASILASLGTFEQQSWITRQDYEELGPDAIEKRFK